jgi:hypothetical protein
MPALPACLAACAPALHTLQPRRAVFVCIRVVFRQQLLGLLAQRVACRGWRAGAVGRVKNGSGGGMKL